MSSEKSYKKPPNKKVLKINIIAILIVLTVNIL